MDIELKITETCFNEIIEGKNFIKHGFSKNKKYNRLFGDIDKLKLISAETKREINKIFQSIDIIFEKEKKYFKINFI